ncbi:MAG: hypothetical protein GXO63_00115 [Candidatus Micrarchaeota archaeon]|nr:hypothetical protein [Candidatus Micrarchaeota archaeon]
MKSTLTVPGSILLFSFLLYFISTQVFPVRWWDETIYANLGWNLYTGREYSFKYEWSDANVGWPKAGFRAPLLPFIVSIFYSLFGPNDFFLNFITPFFGSLGVGALYLLVKDLYNRRVAIYSASFLSVVPVYVVYSGRLLTDVISASLITVSVLFFWLGFERNKPVYRYLCGFSTALAFLARYVSILLFAIYILYFLARYRTIPKTFVTTIGVFLLTISPWIYYGLSEYGSPIGPLIHAIKAAPHWGGVQPWYYYFFLFPQVFSVTFLLALLGLRRIKFSPPNLIILLWVSIMFVFAISLQHKEERYLLPMVPAVMVLAALGTQGKKHIFIPTVLVSFVTSAFLLHGYAFSADECLKDALNFLKGVEENAIVFTDQSPVVFHYTHRKTKFLPKSYSDMLLNEPAYYLSIGSDGRDDLRKKAEETGELVFSCGDVKIYSLNSARRNLSAARSRSV